MYKVRYTYSTQQVYNICVVLNFNEGATRGKKISKGSLGGDNEFKLRNTGP